VDDFSRECIGIEVDFSLTGARVVTFLNRTPTQRGGFPAIIKSDNGSEFTSEKMLELAALANVSQHFFDPRKPTQIGRSEARFSAILSTLGATALNWRSKYAGLEVSDLVKLRQLEDENRRLKKIVADQALNIEALKIVAEGNF